MAHSRGSSHKLGTIWEQYPLKTAINRDTRVFQFKGSFHLGVSQTVQTEVECRLFNGGAGSVGNFGQLAAPLRVPMREIQFALKLIW
jgi:hypothetical protein